VDDTNAIQVVGRDGLKGTLLDPLPPESSERPIRVALDTGQVIEIPGSMLQRHSPGVFQIPLSRADLDRSQSEARSSSQEKVIPVLAEELHVTRHAIPTGGVRVHRRVHEHEETVDIPLRKEHVDVRRVLIEHEVDGPLPVRREGETTIIPIVEEMLVIGKKFVLKEEVHITRTVREERHQEKITLKRQESAVERIDGQGSAVSLDVPAARVREEQLRRPRRRSILGDK
jgi:uncharacterized protein (TIGR02271 family)